MGIATMDTDWRGLFDSIRVPWRDRGSNTSAGNINICCPWCGSDEGFHLSVSEDGRGYYCYRSPQRHSGTSPQKLLHGLGLERSEAIRTLNAFNQLKPRAPVQQEAKRPSADIWAKFQPASSSPRALDYLEGRMFPDARRVADYYDLRIAPSGTWAGRLLLPIKEAARVVSFTGRDMTGRFDPRYLAYKEDRDQSPIYIPDEAAIMRFPRRALLVEGPIDALKIAAAMASQPGELGCAALTGMNLGATKILAIQQAFRRTDELLLGLDKGVPLSDSMQTIATLRAAGLPARPCRLPPGFKDAGEMEYQDVREWIGGLS
jgi:hypothetical protein